MKVIRTGDCGNSPKNSFVEELSIALFTQNTTHVEASVSDSATWELVGRKTVVGKRSLLEEVARITFENDSELQVLLAITHGRMGAVDCKVLTKDGKRYDICNTFEFVGVRGNCVMAIKSYFFEPEKSTGSRYS